MQLPTLSIVTACLNAADTIETMLASVRDQEYPDLEHVVVDGGSTDGTLELLRRAGVRFVSEPDRGRADAINKGVRMTSGDVLGFLNADDRYAPGALRAVGDALAARPEAEWLTGYCRIVDGEGREIRRAVTAYKNFLLRHFGFDLYVTQNFVSDPATFVRRSSLDSVGCLDPRYRISHDYDLWIRLARRSSPLVLRRRLADFRMTEGTLSVSQFERQFREHAEVARLRAGDRRVAVATNAVMSRLIVAVYSGLRGIRRLRADAPVGGGDG